MTVNVCLRSTTILKKTPLEVDSLRLQTLTLRETLQYAITNRAGREASFIALQQAGFLGGDKEVKNSLRVFEKMLPILQAADFISGEEKHWKDLPLYKVKSILDYIFNESTKEKPSPLYRALRAVYLVAIPTLSDKARLPKCFASDVIFRQIVCNNPAWPVNTTTVAPIFAEKDDEGKIITEGVVGLDSSAQGPLAPDRVAAVCALLRDVAADAEDRYQQAKARFSSVSDLEMPMSFMKEIAFLQALTSSLLTTPEDNPKQMNNNQNHIFSRIYMGSQEEILHFLESNNAFSDHSEFMLDLIKINHGARVFQLISDRLKKDPEYVLRCVESLNGDYRILSFMDPELETQQSIIDCVVDLPVGPVEAADERKILAQLAIGNCQPLLQAQKALKDNDRFMWEVLKIIFSAPLPGIDEGFFGVEPRMEIFADTVGPNLKASSEFMRKLVEFTRLDVFYPYLRAAYLDPMDIKMTLEFVKFCKEKKALHSIEHIFFGNDRHQISDNREFMLGYLRISIEGASLERARELRAEFFRKMNQNFRGDGEFMLGALKICKDPKVLLEASRTLKRDAECIRKAIAINPEALFVTQGFRFIQMMPIALYEAGKKYLLGLIYGQR